MIRLGNTVLNEVRLGYVEVGFNCYSMGRKIPGKKHRAVKDPYKQRQKRLDSLRLKINNPPFNADDQEIPKSLLKLVELKNKAKQSTFKKHKQKYKKPVSLSVAKLLDREPVTKGMSKPDVIPNLIQKPDESAKSFLRRVSSMTQDLINEVKFESKFGVEIKKNSETGEIIEIKKLKNKKSKSKKKRLEEKRKAKLNQKKEDLKNVKDFNQLKDEVKFGEVVHKPPDLKVKKLENKIQKPRFNSLLLNKVAGNIQTEFKNSQINLEREKKEIERKFIVEAYRKIKKKIDC